MTDSSWRMESMTSLKKLERVDRVKPCGEWSSQQEALRRAILLKQRKVSVQLKQEMVQRQRQQLLRSDAYRVQLRELSGELRELSRSLDGGLGPPAEQEEGPVARLKHHKVAHQSSTPPGRSERAHWLGELRAVASLSSLNTKGHSAGDSSLAKDAKPWRAPLRFLGQLMDNAGLRRRLWGSSRTRSEDERTRPAREEDSSSSSESEDEGEDGWRKSPPVMRKASCSGKRVQIDPAILAEIEDFEKMAAQYIQQHS